jgi:hypothetical protein
MQISEDLLEGNSQVTLPENTSTKFNRKIAYFRVRQPKQQVQNV